MVVAASGIEESSASPPQLDEVVKELDSDTRHIGRPTHSPRHRRPWKDDPYHFPSYVRKWITAGERNSLMESCSNLDPGRTGRIPVEDIGTVLDAIGEKTLTTRAQRTLPRETLGRGITRKEVLTFRSLIDFLDESVRRDRLPFGRKRCIVSRLPLPPCCANGCCTAHLDKPTPSALAGESDGDLATAALKIVFARHDVDGSGSLELEELPKILDEHGIEYDERRLPDLFQTYDVDRSGGLDFNEFSGLLKDMHVNEAVARKRMQTYDLPASLLKEFSKEAIEEMRTMFGMFDESGDGALDEEELDKLLRTFGQEPSKEKIHQEMLRIDQDRSGTIEFSEFVLLMKKIRDGEIELDDSAFGRAVMNSVTATRLSQELSAMEERPVVGVVSAKLVESSPATLEVTIACPDRTPYEGRVMTLEITAFDGYPFIPPGARFRERVFHLNFSILLDGSTGLRPLLDQWTAAWNVARLLTEVLRLLRNPDPTLLPTDLRRETENASDQRSSIEARPQHMPDDIGAREGVVCFENEEIAVLDEEQWMGVATENQPKTEDTTRAGETRNRDRGVYSQRRRTVAREEYGGVRGNDIRQKQRSAQMMARTAALWYDARPLYEQTARRVALEQQRHCLNGQR